MFAYAGAESLAFDVIAHPEVYHKDWVIVNLYSLTLSQIIVDFNV